ncbi:MAG TPA: hypothetical protein VGE74_12175 [Gemmata sp.]
MREVVTCSFLNVLFFAIWVGVPTISPEAERQLPRAFGNRPFGFPAQRVVFWVMSFLYLPFIPVVCSVMRLGPAQEEMQRCARNHEWERFELLAEQHRVLWRWALFGVVYFITLLGSWIVWAEVRAL